MSTTVDVRPGAYHDSVTLMQVSRSVSSSPGVDAALVAMGTELNLDLARGMGFEVSGAGPNDLVVAVRASDEAALDTALAALGEALAASGGAGIGSGGDEEPARTTAAAVARSGAPLALISVPGPAAFPEALDALQGGAHVMVFSDNVPVEQEVRLKDEGARRGLLVMGPDCGTAAIGGVGLGFANSVRPGAVGIVAASGTGAQQLMCLLDAAGVGVSHCLGVGGRDLSAAVGGRSTRQALRMLDEDPATELIVLVSKPPAAEVEAEVLALAESLDTPVQVALLGRGRADLTAAAERAVTAAGGSWEQPRSWPAGTTGETPTGGYGGALRGLFAGGTLCDEAMVIASQALGPIRSNIPLEPAWALPDDLSATGHAMVDFGDDRLTQGRPHPMIDQRSRLDRLSAEAADPATRVILLDVVLGHGAHPDPAAELAPAVAQAITTARDQGRRLDVVISLCGTEGDPQGLTRQAEALSAAGASVHQSNAAATWAAVALVEAAA